ncbi:MAG TPA: hypothetical protein VN541_07885 [Tepidisphaeraceae bacterium]|nr:hypothetical protein [Tepidisphaeraceae bacterium]
MTAVSLFDVLSREKPPREVEGGCTDRLVQLAEDLMRSSLADLDRVKDYEKRYVADRSGDQETEKLDLLRSVWNLYREWAADANQVLTRAKSLHSDPRLKGSIDRLDDAIGRVEARLSLKPEQIMAGIEQARRGQIIPAGELRRELHARLRA